jgi:hypothetical protein
MIGQLWLVQIAITPLLRLAKYGQRDEFCPPEVPHGFTVSSFGQVLLDFLLSSFILERLDV